MKVEFVDLCGLRLDGRRPGELRKVHAKLGVVSNATGSALLEQGLTKVCTPRTNTANRWVGPAAWEGGTHGAYLAQSQSIWSLTNLVRPGSVPLQS